jgi:hypothetical protein
LFAGAVKAAGKRPFRKVKLSGYLQSAFVLQTAENEWGTVFVGQALELFVQNHLQLAEARFRVWLGHFGCPPFKSSPPGSARACFHRQAIGNAVKPIAEPLVPLQSACLLGKNEKGRLVNILRVLQISQVTAAY